MRCAKRSPIMKQRRFFIVNFRGEKNSQQLRDLYDLNAHTN
jgi:hypothetical protein